MISLYLPGSSWLHRLSAGQKLLILALTSVAIVPINQLGIMLAVLLGVVGLYRVLGPTGWRELGCVRPLLPFLLAILLMHAWLDSWVVGTVVILRLLALFWLANLMTLTTRMSAMMQALQPCFYPLTKVGISSRALALAVALMIRFAPVLASMLTQLDEAWRARGGGAGKWRLLIPLMIQALRLSDQVGDALTARGGSSGLLIQPQPLSVTFQDNQEKMNE